MKMMSCVPHGAGADVSVLRPMNLSLAAKLAAKTFVVTGELTPPKGTDLTKLFAAAELLRSSVDALNLTESPRARMAMDPRAVGRLLQERGIEVIIQVTSRDRNRIAVQSDLLGAAVLGLHNFVFMGGDSPAGGDHPDAKPVFDLTASGLLAAAESLRKGHDYAGNALHGTPELFLGATANPGAPKFEAEVENTRRKIDAGAKMLQTQAIYHVDQLKRFIDAVKPDGVAILAGIIPLKSEKSGPWLNANLPGVKRTCRHARSHGIGRQGRPRPRARHRARRGSDPRHEGHRAGCPHHGHRRGGRSAGDPEAIRRARLKIGRIG